MKANRTIDGDVVLFRPEMNAKRFALSAERMCMPQLPVDLFVDSIVELPRIDKDWVPTMISLLIYQAIYVCYRSIGRNQTII